jgi:2-dehydro-3-deoxy-phosphogluconate aldolase
MRTMKKINDRLLFNFLAFDKKNAADIMEAANGYVVPGIVSIDFETASEAAEKVAELHEITPIVSIGLGGGGDTSLWRKVVDIALLSNPGHINQPFHTTSYTKGILDQAGSPQFVNALIAPSGKLGIVKLADGKEIELGVLLDMAVLLQMESIKVMPMQGLQHIDELVHIAKEAARRGIYGIEPAGGIYAGNIRELTVALLDTDIPFIMPHIFGNTIDSKTRRTIPEKVKEIIRNASH